MASATLTREEIRRQRRRPPLVTQEELAQLLGVGRSQYTRWESGAIQRLPWELDENDAWETLQRLKEQKRRASG